MVSGEIELKRHCFKMFERHTRDDLIVTFKPVYCNAYDVDRTAYYEFSNERTTWRQEQKHWIILKHTRQLNWIGNYWQQAHKLHTAISKTKSQKISFARENIQNVQQHFSQYNTKCVSKLTWCPAPYSLFCLGGKSVGKWSFKFKLLFWIFNVR